MKKVISSIVVLGLVAILVISNATVEAAKKKENVKQEITVKESENVVVAYTKGKEGKKDDIKEKTNIETSRGEEKNIGKEKERTDKNIEKESEEKVKNRKEIGTVGETVSSTTDADGKVSKEDFAIVVNGIKIELGTDINEVIEQLGEPDDYVQARSCLHEGDDKIYTYGGIVIYTYPQGKKDIVYIVEYTGEEKTPAGIGLGSTMVDLEKAYGNKYVEDAFYTVYELEENATISIQFEKEKVIYIEFYME